MSDQTSPPTNPEVLHFSMLYQDAHKRAAVLAVRYTRLLTGVEAVIAGLERDSHAAILLEAVIAASRWDGENNK